MYCGERSLVKYTEHSREVASLRCKAWTCPDCAPDRSARLIAECHGGSPNTFLTLTSRRRPNITPDMAALELTRAWRLVRLRLLRKTGAKKLPFFAVMESTKLGWPHLHILLRSVWIDRQQISQWMQEICDSPIVDIRRIDQRGKIAAYVAKYCSKAAHKFGTAKRYYKSRDYELRSDEELARFKKGQPGFIRSDKHLNWWVRILTEQGFHIERSSKFRIRASRAPPKEGGT